MSEGSRSNYSINRTYIRVSNIRGSSQDVEYRLGDIGSNLLARIDRQLATVEDTQVRYSIILSSGSIGFETAAALAPNADACRVNVLPVALSSIGIDPVNGCCQSSGVLSDESVARGCSVSVWVDVALGVDKGGSGRDG